MRAVIFMESTIKEIRKKLPSSLNLIDCRMLSLGICNFTKQKVNMQDKQQEMKFTSELKNCGQAQTKSHHTIEHRLSYSVTLLDFHGV